VRQGLAVLTYHRVAREPDPLRGRMLTAGEFRGQMRMLSRFFRPVALAAGLRTLRAGTLPPRSVAVTFDDGYADNVQVALPILLAEGVPATFFISTSYLDGGRMWNDTVIEALRQIQPGDHRFRHAVDGVLRVPADGARRPLVLSLHEQLKHLPDDERRDAAAELAALADGPLPSDLMMRRQDVGALLEAGMDVGGHTRTHPILAGLEAAKAEEEIAGGLEDLVSLTGRAVTRFAYPNGRRGRDYGDREVAILRRLGVEAALVTDRGIVRPDSDPLQAPRLAPLHKNAVRFAVALWRAYLAPDWRPEQAVAVAAGYRG
jgi:peptidoglycan/xylan/chitin deacetylase (PgdA/CDA1 family)